MYNSRCIYDHAHGATYKASVCIHYVKDRQNSLVTLHIRLVTYMNSSHEGLAGYVVQ